MTMWNPIHGCTKVSTGCRNCYMYRRDAQFGIDSSVVRKTASFDLPLRKDRNKNWKIPEGTLVYTCFTSDFFHPDADEWRPALWEMMKERSDLKFIFITKRPERFYVGLPSDWGEGYENVTVCCTCENQLWTDRRLPIFLELPIRHKEIIHEPMLEEIHIEKYLEKYGGQIACVTCGGESGEGPEIRALNYGWVIGTQMQCSIYHVPFRFHQTGTYFQKGQTVYHIPRAMQEEQAKKAGIDSP